MPARTASGFFSVLFVAAIGYVLCGKIDAPVANAAEPPAPKQVADVYPPFAAAAVFAAIVYFANREVDARRSEVPIDVSASDDLPSLNERIWYVDWAQVNGRNTPLRVSFAKPCDAQQAEQVVAVLPGMQLSFHFSTKFGPSVKPRAQNGNNYAPWVLAQYDWVVPASTFARQDYFFLEYLLDAGNAVSATPDPGAHTIPATGGPRTVIDLVQQYAWEAKALGSQQLSETLGATVFPEAKRCLQLHFGHSGAVALDQPTHVENLKHYVTEAESGDLALPDVDVGDKVGWPEKTFLKARFFLPAAVPVGDAAMPPQLPSPTPRDVIIGDWSSFFFTDPQFPRGTRYNTNPSYAAKPMEGAGFVTLQIPVTVENELRPAYIPFAWTIKDFENAYPVKVRGLRRTCEFFTRATLNCVSENPPPAHDPLDDAVVSRTDRRVTLWFGDLRARDAIRLAPGHPNGYVRVPETEKSHLLLAAFDHLYVEKAPLALPHAFARPPGM